MFATSMERQRMEVVKSLLAGIMVAALALCAVAAANSSPHAISSAQTKSSISVNALAVMKHLQSLEEEAPAPAEGTAPPEGGATPAPSAASESAGPKPKIYTNEEMDIEGQKWVQTHPQQAQVNGIIWNVGLGFLLVGLIIVMYSEISTVLFYRDKDSIQAAELDSAPPSIELRQREFLWGNGWEAHYRPAMTLGGSALLVITMVVMFYSQCPMIDEIAEHFDISETAYGGNCTLIAIKQAVVTGLGILFFMVGLTWSCTRFLPAFLLLLLSLGADIAGNYAGAAPALLWILLVVAAAGVYFWASRRSSDDAPTTPTTQGKPPAREFV